MSITRVNIFFTFLFGIGIVINCSGSYMDAIKVCKQKYPLTKQQVMQDETEEAKCFTDCLMRKTGRMDSDDNFVRAVLVEEGIRDIKNDEERARYNIGMDSCLEKSKGPVKPGKCEKAFAFFKCLVAEAWPKME